MSERSWTVRVDLDAWSGSMPAEAKLDAWTTALADYSVAAGADDHDRASVTITLAAGSVRQAVQSAIRLVEATTGTKAVGVEVLRTEEFDRRVNEPQIPPLIGQVEMAARLGVSRQRVAQLARERSDFPPEVARTAAGPLYVEAHFVTWSQKERRPGRPPKEGKAS